MSPAAVALAQRRSVVVAATAAATTPLQGRTAPLATYHLPHVRLIASLSTAGRSRRSPA